MRTGLSEETFVRLLENLSPDREQAGQRYEDLRRTLLRFFEWRGAPFPEEQCDETLDRVARRLAEGVDVKNVGGYCYSVARLVLLETRKGPERRRAPIETSNLDVPANDIIEGEDQEVRLDCLEGCLRVLPPEGRELIVEYYQDDKRERIERRKAIAERLGVRSEALANRAQRLRDKLERCVHACVEKKSST